MVTEGEGRVKRALREDKFKKVLGKGRREGEGKVILR